jgi:hypothetical protein
MPFNGKPCKYCKKGMINPSKYQTVCSACKLKNKKKTLKYLRKKWKKNKKRRLKRK